MLLVVFVMKPHISFEHKPKPNDWENLVCFNEVGRSIGLVNAAPPTVFLRPVSPNYETIVSHDNITSMLLSIKSRMWRSRAHYGGYALSQRLCRWRRTFSESCAFARFHGSGSVFEIFSGLEPRRCVMGPKSQQKFSVLFLCAAQCFSLFWLLHLLVT